MAIKHKSRIDLPKLIEQSEKARGTITEARLELRNKFDVAGRVREMVTSTPAKLVCGSLIGGYLLKKLLFRKKRSSRWRPMNRDKTSHMNQERGVLLGILGLFLALAKPAARMYATKLLKNYMANRLASGSRARLANTGKHPY